MRDKWQRAVKEGGLIRVTGDELWDPKFRGIHKQETTKWPDMIHTQEAGLGKEQVQPWKTSWCFEATIEELLRQHVRTYAISLELILKES
jgi:hypothetical protein